MSRTHSRSRRAEVQPTIGLIVEGDAEFAAFPLLHKMKLVAGCPPLKPINLGGVGADRKPEGVAKLVAPKVIQQIRKCRRFRLVRRPISRPREYS